MMKYSVITLFPELIEHSVRSSITGRALKSGLIELQTVQLRDFAVNAYGQVDDAIYGGGTGMLLRPEPVMAAFESIASDESSVTIHLTPKGQVLNQKRVEELAQAKHLIFICGHYEGIDQRVLDEIVDLELSIGDYVLTGGELAANVIIDAVSRLIPGVLPRDEAHIKESHSLGRLEHNHYTRPADWQGRRVPDVLTSGHQKNIEHYQYLSSLVETMLKRPDIFNQLALTAQEYSDLVEFYRTTTCQD